MKSMMFFAIALFPVAAIASEPNSTGATHSCAHYYPIAEQRQGIQGTTTLTFRIARTGNIQNLHIAESSGNSALDNAAVNCAVYWRYTPAMENGRPVTTPWQAKVVWALPPANPAPSQTP